LGGWERGLHDPEANVVSPSKDGRNTGPVRRPPVERQAAIVLILPLRPLRDAHQAPAPHYPGVSVARSDGIHLRRTRILGMPVENPFGCVRVHVLYAPRIRLPTARRPVAGREVALATGPRRVLPLGLCRQAILLALGPAQPFAKRGSVFPTHA